LGGGHVRGDSDYDVTILRIDLNVPVGANCMVGLDFRFYSEEFPEYVGSAYNDAFIAELDSSTWSTSGSTISAPRNFAFDPSGNPISVNAAGVTSMSAANAGGTTFDGATPLLRAATPITPGAHRLYLSIFDQGDHVFDSAVLIDGLRFGVVTDPETQCKPGAVPISVSGTFGPGWPHLAGEDTTLFYSYGGAHRYLGNVYQGGANWSQTPTHINIAPWPGTPFALHVNVADIYSDSTWWGMTVFAGDCATCNYSRNTVYLNQQTLDAENDFTRTKVATHEFGHAIALRHPADSGFTDKQSLPSVMWQGHLPYNVPQSYDTTRVQELYP
jgi:hypothetical protein